MEVKKFDWEYLDYNDDGYDDMSSLKKSKESTEMAIK